MWCVEVGYLVVLCVYLIFGGGVYASSIWWWCVTIRYLVFAVMFQKLSTWCSVWVSGIWSGVGIWCRVWVLSTWCSV